MLQACLLTVNSYCSMGGSNGFIMTLVCKVNFLRGYVEYSNRMVAQDQSYTNSLALENRTIDVKEQENSARSSSSIMLDLNPVIGKFGVYAYLPDMRILSLRDLRGINGIDVYHTSSH
jgi:hypothetical protein